MDGGNKLGAGGRRAIGVLGLSVLAACGGSGGDGDSGSTTPPPVASTKTIGGSVTGIAPGATVVLTNNGGDPLTLAGDGSFTLATPVSTTSAYAVSVSSTSSGTVCSVLRGTGSASGIAATHVSVICGPTEQRAFHPASAMQTPRAGHHLVKLGDGTVLAFGGGVPTGFPPTSVERYNPATDTWSTIGNLSSSVDVGDALALPDGRAVLFVTVSTGPSLHLTADTIIYNPATATATFATPFTHATPPPAVLLLDGRVLASDGVSAEILDPVANTTTVVGSPNVPRASASLVVLADGNVLLAGGPASAGVPAPAEILDVTTGTWSRTGTPAKLHDQPVLRLLPSGRVLLVGGTDGTAAFSRAAEQYDPASKQWLPAGSLSTDRDGGTVTLMPSGKVVVAGGSDVSTSATPFPTTHRSTEIYDPQTNAWTAWADLLFPLTGHAAILTNAGKLLVTGGGEAVPDATTNFALVLAPNNEIGW